MQRTEYLSCSVVLHCLDPGIAMRKDQVMRGIISPYIGTIMETFKSWSPVLNETWRVRYWFFSLSQERRNHSERKSGVRSVSLTTGEYSYGFTGSSASTPSQDKSLEDPSSLDFTDRRNIQSWPADAYVAKVRLKGTWNGSNLLPNDLRASEARFLFDQKNCTSLGSTPTLLWRIDTWANIDTFVDKP